MSSLIRSHSVRNHEEKYSGVHLNILSVPKIEMTLSGQRKIGRIRGLTVSAYDKQNRADHNMTLCSAVSYIENLT